jgi:hypothetical protein
MQAKNDTENVQYQNGKLPNNNTRTSKNDTENVKTTIANGGIPVQMTVMS